MVTRASLRLWSVVAVFLFCGGVSAAVRTLEAVKTFDTGLFSFSYPARYEQVPIKNAPHMLLKLKSESGYLGVSVWENAFDASADIWDDRLYGRILNYVSQGEFVSAEKISVETANGKMRCIRTKVNRGEYGVKFLSYILINEGTLYVVGHMLPGCYTKISRTEYEDNLMRSLYFKPVGSSRSKGLDRSAVKAACIAYCKELNSQLPAEVDEITTLYSVAFVGWTFLCTYRVDMDFSVFSDDELKELSDVMREDGKVAARSFFTQGDALSAKAALRELREYGIKMRMNYVDANGRLVISLLYDYRDFE